MKKRILVFTLLFTLTIAACSGTQPQGMFVMPLVSSGTLDAYNVAVDVQDNGTKHIVWSECPPAGDLSQYCRVLYQRTIGGEPGIQLTFSSASSNYVFANVAALDNGSAVVAFYESGTTCKARYAIIPSVVITNPTVQPVIPGDATISHCDAPVTLAGNGTTVYSVVSRYLSYNSQYYQYRKLLPAADASAADVVTENLFRAVDRNQPLVARVDSAGNLHAAWLFERKVFGLDLFTSRGVEYANNNGVTGNLTPLEVYSSISTSLFTTIDMAVESPTQAHMVYSLDGGEVFDSSLWLATVTSGSLAQIKIALTENLGWDNIYASISNYGASTANQVIVFSAENTTIGDSEVFYKLTNAGGVPAQLSDSPSPIFSPRVAPFDTYFIAGWRQAPGTTCPDEVEYSYFDLGVKLIFQGTDGCPAGAASITTLSTNDPWVAGAWIDGLTSSPDARQVPWIVFNTNSIHLPLIRR